MTQLGREFDIGQYRIQQEPYYAEVRGEVGLFTTAAKSRMPVMLKGPTGCGKTRFIQHMAYRLGRPLITVACHEDLTASDLVGRYLLKGQDTVWVDGPLTLGVKHGAIVYLDEIVEARKDTTVIIHPLTDDRRVLPIEKKGQIVEAVDEGRPMAELLSFAISQNIAPDYASRLMAAFPEDVLSTVLIDKGLPANRQGLVEPLSEREIEVLRLMAEGYKYEEIAERLFVSINTVRYHTRNLYGKLEVNSRARAIGRARELNLI